MNSTLLFEQGLLDVGCKSFFWHHKADESQPVLSSHNGGEMIIVDMPSETVLVMSGVREEEAWVIGNHAGNDQSSHLTHSLSLSLSLFST